MQAPLVNSGRDNFAPCSLSESRLGWQINVHAKLAISVGSCRRSIRDHEQGPCTAPEGKGVLGLGDVTCKKVHQNLSISCCLLSFEQVALQGLLVDVC